jgi:hypothetical protein
VRAWERELNDVTGAGYVWRACMVVGTRTVPLESHRPPDGAAQTEIGRWNGCGQDLTNLVLVAEFLVNILVHQRSLPNPT